MNEEGGCEREQRRRSDGVTVSLSQTESLSIRQVRTRDQIPAGPNTAKIHNTSAKYTLHTSRHWSDQETVPPPNSLSVTVEHLCPAMKLSTYKLPTYG